MPRAISLFSGGLDSSLSLRIVQEQGWQVDALYVQTPFTYLKPPPAEAAEGLGARLIVRAVEDDWLELLRHPRYGYGTAANPCLDCRIYMCRMARQLMEEMDARMVISGEVLGQRPMSQKRRDLDIVQRRSGLEGRLLRPLSARLLAPTIPETEGLVDREKLYAFEGRGRGALAELAERFGIHSAPTPSTGCPLTEVSFAPRVEDLMRHRPAATRWEYEILNVGRHLRLDERTKVVVGRCESENALLAEFAARADSPESALLHPENFTGPDAVVVGCVDDASLALAGALLIRYTRRAVPEEARAEATRDGRTRSIRIRPLEPARAAVPI
jgi:hypothetical protein